MVQQSYRGEKGQNAQFKPFWAFVYIRTHISLTRLISKLQKKNSAHQIQWEQGSSQSHSGPLSPFFGFVYLRSHISHIFQISKIAPSNSPYATYPSLTPFGSHRRVEKCKITKKPEFAGYFCKNNPRVMRSQISHIFQFSILAPLNSPYPIYPSQTPFRGHRGNLEGEKLKKPDFAGYFFKITRG